MSKEELICSFCARTKSQTQLLIAGLDSHICDKCILQAYGIIEDENKKEENKSKITSFLGKVSINNGKTIFSITAL